MDVLLLIIRLILTAIFCTAGLAKLFDRPGTIKALNEFGIPRAAVPSMAILLPVVEIVTGLLFLFAQTSWIGAVIAALMLTAFTIGMVYQMANGNAPDCHCFGQVHSEPVGVSSIVRNGVFLGLTGLLLIAGPRSQGISLINSTDDAREVILGAAAVFMLAIAAFLLKRIADQQVKILRQIELLELTSTEGARAVERNEAGDPNQGLPIGAVFPSFDLPLVDGRDLSKEALLDGGRHVLFLFVSPSCAPCKALVPEIDAWEKDLDAKVDVVLISSGTAQENLEKFGDQHRVVLQKDRELAEKVRAKWTPTAVLMDRNGRIASHLAAGDSAIRELIEKIRTADLADEYVYFTNGHHHRSKIGETAPEFSIEDLSGDTISSDILRVKPTLVVFFSTTCRHCAEMLDDLRKWEQTRGVDDPQLLMFSDGDLEAHRAYDLKAPVIIDKGHKISGGFGMYGTPSAVLVNSDGRIASETAIGAPDIWSLVGREQA